MIVRTLDRSCVFRRRQRRLVHRVDELRRRAEQRHAGRVGEVEEHVAVGVERRPVVEEQRRLGRQRRDQPVPHHPAAGREVEDAVAAPRCRSGADAPSGARDQRAAGTVNDALGDAGGAGRIEDVERVIERQLLESGLDVATVPRNSSQSTVERHGAVCGRLADIAARRRPVRRSAARRRACSTRDRLSCDLAAVEVPVRRDEHAAARSGRTDRGRPARRSRANRTTRRLRSRRHPSAAMMVSGQVGQEAGDAVAGLQAGRVSARLRIVRHRGAAPRAVTVRCTWFSPLKISAGPSSVRAQQVLGEVQPRIGEESRAGHALEVLGDASALGAADAGEIPERGPEASGRSSEN